MKAELKLEFRNSSIAWKNYCRATPNRKYPPQIPLVMLKDACLGAMMKTSTSEVFFFFMLKHRLRRNVKWEQIHSQMGSLCLHIVFLRAIVLVLKVILWWWWWGGDFFSLTASNMKCFLRRRLVSARGSRLRQLSQAPDGLRFNHRDGLHCRHRGCIKSH